MKDGTKVFIGIAGVVSLIGMAFATPIVNLISPILSTGTHNSDIATLGEYALATGETYKVLLKTEGASSIATQVAAYGVGGHNGWHAHPGLVAVTLTTGTIEWFDENCESVVYNAGDAWTEGSKPHYFRNVGKTNVELTATFIIAKGTALRLDEPAPACAAALGLD